MGSQSIIHYCNKLIGWACGFFIVSKIGLVTCSITIKELLGVSINEQNARPDNVCAVCVKYCKCQFNIPKYRSMHCNLRQSSLIVQTLFRVLQNNIAFKIILHRIISVVYLDLFPTRNLSPFNPRWRVKTLVSERETGCECSCLDSIKHSHWGPFPLNPCEIAEGN